MHAVAEVHSRSPLLSLGSVPDVQEHDCDCSWDYEEDDTDGERGVIVGGMPQGRTCGDLSNDAADTDEQASRAGQAAPERFSVGGDAPSSPILVSGSMSSAELASTGVGGWEIVDSCG